MAESYLVLYFAPLVLLGVPIVIATWRRWRWSVVELLALPLPGAVWLTLVATQGGRGRSLSNLVELPLLAVVVAALACLKGPIQRQLHPRLRRYALVLLGSGLAVVMYYVFPDLAE